MHGEVFDKVAKGLVSGGEVGFTVYFHHDPNFATRVDVGMDYTLTGDSAGSLLSYSQTFLPQVINGFLHVTLGFLECRLTIHNPNVGFFPQLFHHC
jgi:hypothetical protein